MNCGLTEQISQLVDGELPPRDAARCRAHLEACLDCQQAHAAFLLLRQELKTYVPTTDAHAQSRALASILGERAPAPNGSAASAGLHGRSRQATREVVRRLPGRLNDAFGVRRLWPAYAATLALLLIGVGFGLRWIADSHRSLDVRRLDAPAAAHTNGRSAEAADGAEAAAANVQSFEVSNGPTIDETKAQRQRRFKGVKQSTRASREQACVRCGDYLTGREGQKDFGRDPRSDVSGMSSHALSPLATSDKGLSIEHHAEQVERLLRSFRNARLTEDDPAFSVADARSLSKHLLYSNIALRREAAGAGDLSVEGWLDSLEPILLDISNLANNPSQDAVGSIKEQIRRRQIVGILQARAMLATTQ
jgi:hypothetical protein